VTVQSPGEDPVIARRTVFDRVPAEVRFGGSPTVADVQPIELVQFAEGGEPDFPPLLGADAFAITTGPLSSGGWLARAADPQADAGSLLSTSYVGLRDVIAAEHLIGDGVATFVDRPGVVSFSVDVGTSGDSPTVRFGLDIWHHGLGAMPTTDGAVTPPRAALLAGVVEHVAERVALGAGVDATTMDARPVGVSRVFEAAEQAGIPSLVLRGDMPDDLPFDVAAKSLIAGAVEAGDVVIVPARPVDVGGQGRLGWWRIDPDTGLTADVMDDGTGSETTQYALLVRVMSCLAVFAPEIFGLGWALLGLIEGGAVPSALSGVAAVGYAAFWRFRPELQAALVAACLRGTPV
jgi:hypothetical protein